MAKDLEQFYRQLDRSYFMESFKECASIDSPFPIGYGQTISQPSLVLYMTQLLELEKKHSVLEIGTGSGYQTAFLAEFGAQVYTVERIEALLVLAKKRLDALGYTNIHYTLGDGSLGLATHAPFDRIMVTAAASMIPDELLAELGPEGVMVIPVGGSWSQDLLVVKKDENGAVTTRRIESVRFVPLVGKYEI